MNDNIDYEIVDKLLKKSGKKKGEYYNSVGYSRQSSNNYKAQGYIPAHHAAKIAKFFNVDTDYLLGNQDEFRKVKNEIQLNNNYIELPMIHAGAGSEAFAVDNAERISYPLELVPPQIALDENVLVMIVVGNSMEPLYYENDVVFIDMVNDREFIPVNGTYLVRYGDTVQIKDVEFLGNGNILLFSRNSPAIINPSDLGVDWEIVGKPYVNLHPYIGSKLKIKE